MQDYSTGPSQQSQAQPNSPQSSSALRSSQSQQQLPPAKESRVLFGILTPSEVDHVMSRSVSNASASSSSGFSPKRALALTNGASLFGRNDARHAAYSAGFGVVSEKPPSGKKKTLGSVASGKIAANPGEQMRPLVPQSSGQTGTQNMPSAYSTPMPSTYSIPSTSSISVTSSVPNGYGPVASTSASSDGVPQQLQNSQKQSISYADRLTKKSSNQSASSSRPDGNAQNSQLHLQGPQSSTTLSINRLSPTPSQSRKVSQPTNNNTASDLPPDLSASLPQANPLFSQSNPTNGPSYYDVPPPVRNTNDATLASNRVSSRGRAQASRPLALEANASTGLQRAVSAIEEDASHSQLSTQAQSVQQDPKTIKDTRPSQPRIRFDLPDVTISDAPVTNPADAPALAFSRSAIKSRHEQDTGPMRSSKASTQNASKKGVNMLTLTADRVTQREAQQQQQMKAAQTASIPRPSTPPSVPSTSTPTSPQNMPKSAMKPKSWADILSPPTSASESQQGPPAQKRVSIALPPEDPDSQTMRDSTASLTANDSKDSMKHLPHIKPNGIVYPGQGSPVSPAFGVEGPSIRRRSPWEDKLQGVETQFASAMIQPRGIINRGNMCFENTILQTLLFCGPFFNLMRLLGNMLPSDLSGKTLLLQATIALFQNVRIVPASNPGSSQEYAEPFVPEEVYDALKHNKRFASMQQGRQEDAQEFLGFFLETLHEELILALERLSSNDGFQPALSRKTSEDGWLEVGMKGRTATTRRSDIRESPITRIFGGVQRSLLRVPGQKDSALSEPFLALQLDVQPTNVETIEDALANLSQPETVNDYIVKGGLRVDATKQLFLEQLPPVLILHLKRFSYNNVGGVIKNSKVVGYKMELEISPSILTPAHRSSRPIKYRLAAVIYHHGRNAAGGHYTVAVRQQNGQWIDIDDTTIRQLAPADVAVDRMAETLRLSLPSAGLSDGLPDRVAYVMFYTKM